MTDEKKEEKPKLPWWKRLWQRLWRKKEVPPIVLYRVPQEKVMKLLTLYDAAVTCGVGFKLPLYTLWTYVEEITAVLPHVCKLSLEFTDDNTAVYLRLRDYDVSKLDKTKFTVTPGKHGTQSIIQSVISRKEAQ